MVLLVNMPFSGLRWPAIGVGLLQAGLARAGVACDVAYFNLPFARRLGLARYDWINESFGFVLGGERLFAKHLFGDALPDDAAYFEQVLRRADPGFTAADRRAFEEAAEHVGPFLDACFRSVDWSRYRVVGFSATFQQTLASLALARRVKAAFPSMVIALGGANCEGVMGREILGQFPFVDAVFSGEADASFPACVAAWTRGESPPPLPGVFTRAAQAARAVAPGQAPADPGGFAPAGGEPAACSDESARGTVLDLDALPYPDYDAYFEQLRASGLADQIEPLLLFETARGCWWGARQHCAFCGLNGGGLAFRGKSPRRALEELRHLRQRYGARRACATDNILDYRYDRELLPLLAEARLDLALEYELKTNLTREQIQRLTRAGVAAAQLGVESLSTPALRRMRKGVTASQNLRTLKWFTAAGVEVKWNFLYGLPGETPDDYADLPELFHAIRHLAPPQAAGAVRVDRFSPYFEHPEQFGLAPPRPVPAYRFVYPFPAPVIERLAYYFDNETAPGPHPPAYVEPALAAIDAWRQDHARGTLSCRQTPQGVLVLFDTRPGAAAFEHRLPGWQGAVYRHCDAGRRPEHAAAFARTLADAPDEAAVLAFLERCAAQELMARRDGVYISLGLEPW